MSRRTRPSARTTRTAPTAPCVPVSRDGARVPRSVPPDRGASHRESAPARAWKVDRSVAQGRPADPAAAPATASPGRPGASPAGWPSRSPSCSSWRRWRSTGVTYVDRYYDHFVWQAAAFLEGQAAIRYPVEPVDGLPRQRAASRTSCRSPTTDGVPRGAPAVPAAARRSSCCRSSRVWGLATNDQADLHGPRRDRRGLCWWTIGRLPVGAGRPPRDDDLLRLRDRLLVHRAARDDLVPGAHRRGRADVPGDRPRARRRSGGGRGRR